MFERGDVVRVKGRLGFVPADHSGTVLVVQVPDLTQILPTVVVIPLDPVPGPAARQPWAVPLTAVETGGATAVALVPQLCCVPLSALAPGISGRASPDTQARVDRVLRFTLGL